ncbi:MAG: metallophosphoesterase [Planctomycetes bacterium]|nr:metallophosphoesterase [Planctomycetota bacterium]
MNTKNLLHIFLTSTFAVLTAILIAFVLSVYIGAAHTELNPLPLLGNHAEYIAQIQSQTAPKNGFTAAFIGDVNNVGIHNAALLVEEVQKQGVDFIILGGDLVRFGTEERFLHSLYIFSDFIKDAPLLVVPGNHDLYPDSTIFERLFDRKRFFFVLKDCLFMIVDTGKGFLTQDDFDWIEKTLKDNAGVKSRLLFSHRPLINWDNPETKKDLPDESVYEPLRQMLDKYKVDYVFSGHVHDFRQERRGHTTYLIEGGGPIKDIGRELRILAYIKMDNGTLTVTPVPTLSRKSTITYFKLLSLVSLYPWYKAHSTILTIIIVGFLAGYCALTVYLYRRLARKPTDRRL